MTKLLQWLSVLFVFLAVWLSLVTDQFPLLTLSAASHEVTLMLPIYILITFACYSLAVIGYRVATFNDCVEAANELKQQIEDARRDLTSKGFKFAST